MKQKIRYSGASGALTILTVLIVVICFLSPTQFYSLYQNNLGKTHFIVGYPNAHTTPGDETPVKNESPTHATIKTILFSPDDDLQQELITLIQQEKKSIRIAIFTFTDKEVAQALIDAALRGVAIEVVADTSYLRDQYSKIAYLQRNKIPIFTYNPHYKNATQKKQDLLSIMHNKFALFEQNVDSKALVWTGSFNFTRSAKLRNQENVVILDDRHAFTKFNRQFERLKQRCDDCYEEGPMLAAASKPASTVH